MGDGSCPHQTRCSFTLSLASDGRLIHDRMFSPKLTTFVNTNHDGLCVTISTCRLHAYCKCNQTRTTQDRLNSAISPRWTASATLSSRSRRTRLSQLTLRMTSQSKATMGLMRALYERRRRSHGSSTPSLHYSALRCYGLGIVFTTVGTGPRQVLIRSSLAGTCFSPLRRTLPRASDPTHGCSRTSSPRRCRSRAS